MRFLEDLYFQLLHSFAAAGTYKLSCATEPSVEFPGEVSSGFVTRTKIRPRATRYHAPVPPSTSLHRYNLNHSEQQPERQPLHRLTRRHHTLHTTGKVLYECYLSMLRRCIFINVTPLTSTDGQPQSGLFHPVTFSRATGNEYQ